MKNTFRIVIALPLVTVIATVLAGLILMLARWGSGASFDFVADGANAAIEVFPFAILISCFVCFFIHERFPGVKVVSFLAIFIFAYASMAFVAPVVASMRLAKPAPIATVGETPAYPLFAKPSEKAPWRIAYGPSANATSLYVKPDSKPILQSGKTEPGAAATKDARLRQALMLPSFVASFADEAGSLGAKLASLASGGVIERFLYPAVLAFFFASLWLFPRLTHWKALNLLLALIALRGFFFLATALSGDLLGSFVDKTFPGAGRDLVSMVAFGAIALVLVAWDFARGVLGRGKEEA